MRSLRSYNSNSDKRIASAVRDLAIKLKLEPKIKREMINLFDEMATYGKNLYKKERKIATFNAYKPELVYLLKNHYKRVQLVFSNQIREEVDKVRSKADDRMSYQIQYELDRYSDEQSNQSANQIIETSNEEFQEYILSAYAYYASQGIIPTEKQVIEKAYEDFMARAHSRAETIAITETQGPAENAKYTEALLLSSISAGLLYDSVVEAKVGTKYWMAILDDRTREWHVEADGQKRPLDQPFIVMGENLMYPKDTSMGASAENVINCRCSTVYKMEEIYY
jgi:uncharacterized protein with gpF-like domain